MIDKDQVRQAIMGSGLLEEVDKLGKDHLRNMVIEMMVERQLMRLELETLKNPKIIVPH
jgi:hypothetical protein